MIKIVPITQKAAFEFVKNHHRHHKPPVGSVFQIAAEVTNGFGEKRIAGVAIIGRPVARGLQDGFTAEVIRLCSDGYANVCSMLYAASWRVAKNMGYTRLVTYILETEPGVTPRAAGWHKAKEVRGRSWDTPARRRTDKHPTIGKQRFEITSRV